MPSRRPTTTRCSVLKTECPKCKGWVSLPFQTGTETVVCSNCSEPAPIKDVHVSAGPFMMYREAITGNLTKYMKLLAEAEVELAGLREKDALTGAYGISIKSLGLFITSLKELLDGCRNDPRHPLNHALEVEFLINGRASRGSLVNLSVTGACIDAKDAPAKAALKSEISVKLSGKDREFLIPGKVMWTDDAGLIGVMFTSDDAEAREFLKSLIIEKSLILA